MVQYIRKKEIEKFFDNFLDGLDASPDSDEYKAIELLRDEILKL